MAEADIITRLQGGCMSLLHPDISAALRQELHRAQKEHDSLRARLAETTALPDMTDEADRIQTSLRDLARYHAVVRRCEELEKALQSLARGDYGICELCGEPIALRRLMAVPSTRLCIHCQTLLEAQQAFDSHTGAAASQRL
ncbi:MAG: transcriptional regulator, TraR/DksA family [Desulfomicrobiaceae bacterium]|jgi:DnaK suppressor protein|nr:transcriptional regulator, TraR/DksA family [Desulfomicrobiaceae bacterium]